MFLEELTTFDMGRFCYEVNALQYDALKDLVEQMLQSVGKETTDDWSYYMQGKIVKIFYFILYFIL